ncbi:unnamed protein product [Camellia sinensis]
MASSTMVQQGDDMLRDTSVEKIILVGASGVGKTWTVYSDPGFPFLYLLFSGLWFREDHVFILAATALLNCIVLKRSCFLFLGAAFTISVGELMGFYQTGIRRKFNFEVMNKKTMSSKTLLEDVLFHVLYHFENYAS